MAYYYKTPSDRIIVTRNKIGTPIISDQEKIKIYNKIKTKWLEVKNIEDLELLGVIMFNFLADMYGKEEYYKSLNWDFLAWDGSELETL